LQEFLEEFEELAKRCRLTTREKAKVVVKYVDRETRKFWTRLEGYGDNYARLKKKIMGAYSKNLEDELTMAELIKLIKKSAKGTIEDEEDLGTYYRKFRNIAADLVEEEIINKRQHDKYFWKGLPCELCYAICDHLEARDPDFECNQVPKVEIAMKAGYFVLRKAAARRRWGGMSKKGKKGWREKPSDEESSEDEKSEDEVIGVETETESDSEEDERKMKRSGKKEEEEAR